MLSRNRKLLHKIVFIIVIVVTIDPLLGLVHYIDEEPYLRHSNNQANYKFAYGVEDHNTGDVKKQWEIRKGNDVQGGYMLLDADGSVRTVRYTADNYNGFKAVVTMDKSENRPQIKTNVYHPILNQEKPLPQQNAYIKEKEPHHKYIYMPSNGFYNHKKKTAYSNSQKLSQVVQSSRPHHTYEVVENFPNDFYVRSAFPSNHSPVYTGVKNYVNLVEKYKHYREQNLESKKQKFDYGINDYPSKKFNGFGEVEKSYNQKSRKNLWSRQYSKPRKSNEKSRF